MANCRVTGTCGLTVSPPVQDGTLVAHPSPRAGIVNGQRAVANPAANPQNLTPRRRKILFQLRAYYLHSAVETPALPFAHQLYYIAEQWFTLSKQQGSFIDDAFANAASDVNTDPKYNRFENHPLLFANRFNLAVLGTEHLKDHIRPAFIQHLRDGIEAGMRNGQSCPEAYTATARQLTSEHEIFLAQAIPYGINKLIAEGTLDAAPHLFDFGSEFYIKSVQSNARGMRFYAALEVLQDYASKGLVPSTQVFPLAHETEAR